MMDKIPDMFTLNGVNYFIGSVNYCNNTVRAHPDPGYRKQGIELSPITLTFEELERIVKNNSNYTISERTVYDLFQPDGTRIAAFEKYDEAIKAADLLARRSRPCWHRVAHSWDRLPKAVES